MTEFDYRATPIYINVRDRVQDLRNLVAWLEEARYQNIILLDNQSTYPPLLEFLESTTHKVIHLSGNFGKLALWNGYQPPDEYFVYTDPDVLPVEECPYDAVGYLHELLQLHPYPKAGLGLYLDDVPADMESLPWEKHLVSKSRQVRKGVYGSMIDTTFSLYRPKANFEMTSLRTSYPYAVRHTTWYRWNEPTEEESYYLKHAVEGPLGSSWKQSLSKKARRAAQT